MKLLFYTLLTLPLLSGFVETGHAQDKKPLALSLQVGLCNNLSLTQFAAENELNIPSTALANLRLAADLPGKNNRNLFLGFEVQALNYYPTPDEKANLSYISLLAGRTRQFDVSRAFYVAYTGGLALSTLAYGTSSGSGYGTYSGGPFRNLNLGVFNMLQFLLAQAKASHLDAGLGLEVALRSKTLYADNAFPSYLKHNGFFQYGLNLNMRYNLARRSADLK